MAHEKEINPPREPYFILASRISNLEINLKLI